MRVSEAEWRVWEGVCKVENSHRDKTEQCPSYIYTIAESVYLVLNSLLDWESVDKFKQRCDVISFTFLQYEASSTVLYATKAWTEEADMPKRIE